jgi:guanylate kinase
MHRSGILFIISGPSGGGKTTLCDRLGASGEFTYSVSCTTRAPRKGEVDGKDYFFLDVDTFQKRIEQKFFLEHAVVHGNHYGTPITPIKDAVAKGKDLLLAIDVQGAAQVRLIQDHEIQNSLIQVFITPPTFAELERRLRKRATDDEATIQRRLTNARAEMSHWSQYDYVIFSGTPEEDERRFRSIYEAERYRTSRMELEIK